MLSTPIPVIKPVDTLSIHSIRLPDWQPRQYFDPAALQGLVRSVEEYGILEPLLVRSLGNGEYELIAGERRLRAAQIVGLSDVPVVVKDLSERQALIVALVENLLREDLSPLEETEGILQLLGLHLEKPTQQVIALLYRMQNDTHRLTHNAMGHWEADMVQEVFSKLSMSWESFVNNRLPLLKLPSDILVLLRQGKIAYTKAKLIAKVKDEQQRQKLLDVAISENLSLVDLKQRIVEELALQTDSNSQSSEVQSLRQLFDSTYRSLKKAKVWHNPEKQVQLQHLLSQIQLLITENE
jgi:ParB family transcriptional regulator, chromosome partitioning protein